MERYELIRALGTGNFGVAKLARDRATGTEVAIKYIERGDKIDENVGREVIVHRGLNHPNVIKFREVFLTPTHLGIVMEFASGGELFERILGQGRFSENEARFYYQQLISGVKYLHNNHVAHRDLKLENTLLGGSGANRGPPIVKICDFGYSKHSLLHSQPKSTVGTPAYIAPEVLSGQAYDGKSADVWSCGVALYVMLVGAYPFEDPNDPRNFRKTIELILNVRYSYPPDVHLTPSCLDLLQRVFVAAPDKRITISEILQHEWFVQNLPDDLGVGADVDNGFFDMGQRQSPDEINRIIQAARAVPGLYPAEQDDLDMDDDDIDGSGDYGYQGV